MRDGNRCVITGRYDENKAQELELTDEDREGILTGWTECAHTIPFSTAPRSSSDGAVDSSEPDKIRTWALIYRYFPAVEAKLNIRSPSEINAPRNALAMPRDLHFSFGLFKFAFEAVDDNSYRVRTFRGLPSGQKKNVFRPGESHHV